MCPRAFAPLVLALVLGCNPPQKGSAEEWGVAPPGAITPSEGRDAEASEGRDAEPSEETGEPPALIESASGKTYVLHSEDELQPEDEFIDGVRAGKDLMLQKRKNRTVYVFSLRKFAASGAQGSGAKVLLGPAPDRVWLGLELDPSSTEPTHLFECPSPADPGAIARSYYEMDDYYVRCFGVGVEYVPKNLAEPRQVEAAPCPYGRVEIPGWSEPWARFYEEARLNGLTESHRGASIALVYYGRGGGGHALVRTDPHVWTFGEIGPAEAALRLDKRCKKGTLFIATDAEDIIITEEEIVDAREKLDR